MANDVEAGSKANEDSIDYKSVLAFLQKRGLTSTVNVLRNELEGGNSANNSSTSTGSSGMMLLIVQLLYYSILTTEVTELNVFVYSDTIKSILISTYKKL